MDAGVSILVACFICYWVGFLTSLVFTRMKKKHNQFKQATFKHENKVIIVLNAVVTCETTAIFCKDCKKQLKEPKTDCR